MAAHFTLLSVNKKGFTLVELLVVITIIAILSIIGLVVFTNVQKGVRDAKRRGDINAIAKALEIYKSQNGKYPMGGAGAISCEGNWDCNDGRTECLKKYLVPTYIQELPKDPQNICNWGLGKFYKYHSPSADGSWYQVAASLENTSASTGDFTVGCEPGCIFTKTNGGFGYNNQQ